jgi:hypothetical protein
MWRQWKTMGQQAELLGGQIAEMAKQTHHLEGSVAVATASAAAAHKGADATRDSIEMFINKERARLQIEMKPVALPTKPEPAHTVDFTVNIHGATAAFITDSLCVAYIFPWEVVDEPELGAAVMFPIHELPTVIPANSAPLDCFAFLSSSNDVLISQAKTRRFFIGIRGFIRYKDVFDRERITSFRYVWRFSEGMTELSDGRQFGDWLKNGKPEENQNT